MFLVGTVLIADEVATAAFACDLAVCKGACCVVGDAGAPVVSAELPVLNRAFHQLKNELPEASVSAVETDGLFEADGPDYELRCNPAGACVFVVEKNGVALCAIQKAFYEGRFDWEKPLSCHLFPIRISRTGGMDLMNFQYIPSLCSGGAACGRRNRTGLAEFLEKPLTRAYGAAWYASFLTACRERRTHGWSDA